MLVTDILKGIATLEENCIGRSPERPGSGRLNSNSESGAALLLILALTASIAASIMFFSVQRQETASVQKARAAGWHLAQVAKAARLYVRNNSVGNTADNNGDGIPDNSFAKSILAGPSPIEFTIADLIAGGLLPPGFSQFNALGQNIRIFAANYPVDGDPDDYRVTAAAYILLEDNDYSTPRLMQFTAQEANKAGLDIIAPVFSGGTNISTDCDGDGEADVSLWDSGCLDLDEYQMIISDPAAVFEPGSLLVPAWRSVQPDPRVISRYPQPENETSSLMLTDLKMGSEMRDASGNCIAEIEHYYMEDDGSFTAVPTGLCDVEPDDSSLADWREADKRMSIYNTRSISTRRMFLVPQPPASEFSHIYDGAGGVIVTADPHNMAVANAQEVLHIAGTLNANAHSNVLFSGRLPNPSGSPGDPGYRPSVDFTMAGGGMGTLRAFQNVVVGSPSVDSPAMKIIGSISLAEINFRNFDNDGNPLVITGTLYTDELKAGKIEVTSANLGALSSDGTAISAVNTTITLPSSAGKLTATSVSATEVTAIDIQNENTAVQEAYFSDLSVTGDLKVDSCSGPVCPDVLP